MTYINELSAPTPYIYNMRLYRLQNCKSDSSSTVRIGLCNEGLEVYEVLKHYIISLITCLTCAVRTYIPQLHDLVGINRYII